MLIGSFFFKFQGLIVDRNSLVLPKQGRMRERDTETGGKLSKEREVQKERKDTEMMEESQREM
jgi:hypothetical protein